MPAASGSKAARTGDIAAVRWARPCRACWSASWWGC